MNAIINDEVGLNGTRTLIDMTVEPIPDKPGGPRSLVVIFKGWVCSILDEGVGNGGLVRDEHVERPESDLRVTRERLQATT